MPELSIFDFKIGFYLKFPAWNCLERFKIWNPGQSIKNISTAIIWDNYKQATGAFKRLYKVV